MQFIHLVAHNSHSSFLWLCMHWSTWQSQWTGAGFQRRVLPWWIVNGPATRTIKVINNVNNVVNQQFHDWPWEQYAWQIWSWKIDRKWMSFYIFQVHVLKWYKFLLSHFCSLWSFEYLRVWGVAKYLTSPWALGNWCIFFNMIFYRSHD